MYSVIVEVRQFAPDSLDRWLFRGIFVGNDHSCRKNEKQLFFGKNVSLKGLHAVEHCYRAAMIGEGRDQASGRQIISLKRGQRACRMRVNAWFRVAKTASMPRDRKSVV